jgi:hypothetical protein
VARQLQRLKHLYLDYGAESAPEAPTSHSRKKRDAMKSRTEEEHQPVGIVPGEGWSLQRPDSSSDEFVSAVCCVRQCDDGPNVKLFQVAVKPSVVKARAAQAELERAEKAKQEALECEAKQKEITREAKKKRARLRRKLRQLDQSMDRLTKQEARVKLFWLGKY